MRFLIGILALMSFELSASEYLVYKHTENKIIREKILKGPIQLKRRLRRDIRLHHRDLGKRVTPFYYHQQGVVHALYQSRLNGCLRLTIADRVTALRWNCNRELNLKLEAYPAFEMVKASDLPEFEHQWNGKSLKKGIQGFSFYYHLRDLYIGDNRAPKLDWFKINLTEQVEVSNSKNNGFKLLSRVKVERAKFHFYSARTKQKVTTLTQDQGDFLFENDQGDLILYKRYQPTPLDFRFLGVKKDFENHLATVESNLFQFDGKRVCFIDYAISHSQYDCEDQLLNGDNFMSFNRFDLVFINLNDQEIRLIK